MNTTPLSFRALPATAVSSAGYPKRYRSKGSFSQPNLLLRWFRRPSIFLLALFCLLIAPSLWFVSRTVAPTPAFVAELEAGRQKKLSGASTKQETVTAQDELLPIKGTTANSVSEPDRVKVSRQVVSVGKSPPRAPQDELLVQAPGEQNNTGNPEKTWETPEMPAEVFRDVPPEECLPSPLWNKRVDPSDYEFGCDEIFVSFRISLRSVAVR